MPPLLWPLAVTLLRSGYVVLIAVPHSEDAEQLERRLNLEEKSAFRVLIYDPEDVGIEGGALADINSQLPSPHSIALLAQRSPSASRSREVPVRVTLTSQSPNTSLTSTRSSRSTL